MQFENTLFRMCCWRPGNWLGQETGEVRGTAVLEWHSASEMNDLHYGRPGQTAPPVFGRQCIRAEQPACVPPGCEPGQTCSIGTDSPWTEQNSNPAHAAKRVHAVPARLPQLPRQVNPRSDRW